MAIYSHQQMLFHSNLNDANFRAWGSAISAEMTAMGWAKTADTGQVNWTTVTVPATGVLVYEIWEPVSDPLQTGSTKYYVKLEYGNWNTGANAPGFRAQLGTGTNGAGTLTGITTVARGNAGTGYTIATLPAECNFCGDISRIGMMLWRDTNASYNGGGAGVLVLCIERTKTAAGVDSPDGVTIVTLNPQDTFINTLRQQQTIVFGLGATSNYDRLISLGSNLASEAFHGNVPISPIFPIYGKFGNPLTMGATGRGADFTEGGYITATMYGATTRYICTKRGLADTCGPNGVTGSAFLMRFD